MKKNAKSTRPLSQAEPSAAPDPAPGSAASRLKRRLRNIRAMDAANRSGMSGPTRAYLIVAIHILATSIPIILTLLVAPLYFPVVFLVRPVLRYQNIWVRSMSWIAYFFSALFTGTRVIRDTGLVIPEHGHILLVNHVNEFEFHFDRRVIDKPFLANQALKVSPFIYAGLRMGAGITFDEFDGRDMARSLNFMRDVLNETCVIVYPEGRRTFSEEIQELKTGVLKLAYREKIPVTPVMKTGMSRLRPFGNRLVYFSPGTLRPEEYADFAAFHAAVSAFMAAKKREHNTRV